MGGGYCRSVGVIYVNSVIFLGQEINQNQKTNQEVIENTVENQVNNSESNNTDENIDDNDEDPFKGQRVGGGPEPEDSVQESAQSNSNYRIEFNFKVRNSNSNQPSFQQDSLVPPKAKLCKLKTRVEKITFYLFEKKLKYFENSTSFTSQNQ